MSSHDCECQGYCDFFDRHEGMFGPVEAILRANLCGRGGDECARHVVAAIAGRDAVPAELFPSDLPGAMKLIDRHREMNGCAPAAR